MIQVVIERMGRNSFLLKGWSVTLAAALIGLAAADSNRAFAVIAAFTGAMLGLLDAYYLAVERAYRALYDAAAAGRAEDWSLAPGTVTTLAVIRALGSPTVLALHGLVVAASVVVAASAT